MSEQLGRLDIVRNEANGRLARVVSPNPFLKDGMTTIQYEIPVAKDSRKVWSNRWTNVPTATLVLVERFEEAQP